MNGTVAVTSLPSIKVSQGANRFTWDKEIFNETKARFSHYIEF